ncbi:MAG: sugar ABC transporter substrate-binding protein [Fusobacteriaceae bacterium]
MNLKKLSLIGALALIAVACGGKKEESTKAPSETKKATEIVLWEQMEPGVRDLYLKKVEAFNTANPDIKVSVTHYSNEDLRTQFLSAAQTGQGPDLAYGPNDFAGIFQVAGLIKPLTEVLNPNLLANFSSEALKSGEVNGKLYALPEFEGNHIALLYNKKLVPEAPKNFDEFIAIAQANQKIDTANKANSTYGFLYNEKEPFWFVGLYNGFGGAVFNDKNEPTLNNPAMVDALQFAHDIRNKYKIGEAGMDYDMSSELFKQGKAAMILNGAWSWSEYLKDGMDIGVSYMPLPNGKTALFYSASKGYSVSENTKAEKYEAINKFFEYIYTPENNADISLASSQVPVIKAAKDLPSVKNDFLMNAATDMIKHTVPGPVIAEMRAVWDGIRPNLEGVLNGSLKPEDAAKKIQDETVQGVNTIKGN